MNKRLHLSLILALLGLFFVKPAAASHMQGGDLTYASLGNNRYLVTLHVFRDCSGISLSPFTLECRSGGCNAPASITTPFTQVGLPIPARQYCATLTGVCNGTVTNTEAYTFTATVTLPPAAQWTLSTSQSARPSTANIYNAGDLYFEATLNNLLPQAGTAGTPIINNSPVASVQPAFFVPVHQLTTLSNNAFDTDGDSLVYSLETPLQACSSPVNFTNYPSSANAPVPINPTCFYQPLFIPYYSATLPIFVDVDTIGTCPMKTGVTRFSFDARTGNISLQPGRYLNTNSANGDNKYAASVKISEYRRIGGSYVLVGTMRRELYFMVYDCGTNLMPVVGPQVAVQSGTSSTVQALSQTIPVVAGQSVSVVIDATDRNAGQSLALTLDYNAVPGASLQSLGNGQARLTFTPAASTAPGLYRVAVTAEDNACPIKGMDTKTLTFRVSAASSTLAARAKTAASIAAYPNPFTDEVHFQLSTPGVQFLTISDYLGRAVATVQSQPNGAVRWQPAANLPTGLYLARSADGSQSVRLLRSAVR
ncbi:T9SS type A sorting domain-containing protein [Hymenobacter sp. M29]|uniref:T9SS type A sorting domain-containing protein n=1 Tax=Hymenobacter mellowenesis TaxID=3063995 RepID=A0ABT9A4R4_9BACT|nr:T9SS type A sorting domain-containing protein [Hymenobacter sp. M29]MDO7844830.1 T9SS type A sorting domain-containing protein [Hymenobacter sp. M29]